MLVCLPRPPASPSRAGAWTGISTLSARSLEPGAELACIVNVGAYVALRAGASMGAYAAAKASIIRLTESMSAKLRENRINVYCVLPTILDTPQYCAYMPQAHPTPRRAE